MNQTLLKEYYEKRSLGNDALVRGISLIERFETLYGLSENADVSSIDLFIQQLAQTKDGDTGAFLALMRYFRLIGNNPLFIRLTQYTGGLGVAESIYKKLEHVVGATRATTVTSGLTIPSLVTPPAQRTIYTQELMLRLQAHLNEEEITEVLSDNHHQIPESEFYDEKVRYEQAESLDAYLLDLHARSVEILAEHARTKKVWYEQNITDEVVEFVRANPEIQSAVRKGDDLYVTKIPYDIEKYLHAPTPELKKYYACHCAFAREIVFQPETKISPLWCHCSAGFTKLPFEVVLGVKLKATLLQNVLQGDQLCRFKISLKGVSYKH